MQKGVSLCIINSSGHALQINRNKTEFHPDVRVLQTTPQKVLYVIE